MSMKLVLEVPDDLANVLSAIPARDRNRCAVTWMRAGKRAESLASGVAVPPLIVDEATATMDDRDVDPVEVALAHLRTRAERRQHTRFVYL